MTFRLLFLSLLLACSFVLAQKEGEAKVDDKAATDKKDTGEKKPEEKIADPLNMQQAKELFGRAIEFQQKQKIDKAIECYAKLSVFYRFSKNVLMNFFVNYG